MIQILFLLLLIGCQFQSKEILKDERMIRQINNSKDLFLNDTNCKHFEYRKYFLDKRLTPLNLFLDDFIFINKADYKNQQQLKTAYLDRNKYNKLYSDYNRYEELDKTGIDDFYNNLNFTNKLLVNKFNDTTLLFLSFHPKNDCPYEFLVIYNSHDSITRYRVHKYIVSD